MEKYFWHVWYGCKIGLLLIMCGLFVLLRGFLPFIPTPRVLDFHSAITRVAVEYGAFCKKTKSHEW